MLGGGHVIRASDLSLREVINTTDGRRLGNIVDVELDLNTGKVLAIVVPGQARVFGIFGRTDDYIIPWENIKKIGEDVILVELSDRYLSRTNR